jgi:hypothetical protein
MHLVVQLEVLLGTCPAHLVLACDLSNLSQSSIFNVLTASNLAALASMAGHTHIAVRCFPCKLLLLLSRCCRIHFIIVVIYNAYAMAILWWHYQQFLTVRQLYLVRGGWVYLIGQDG